MNILSLNPGSSSLKFGLFGEQTLLLDSVDHEEGVESAVAKARAVAEIDAVACRVVHGGNSFSKPTLITNEVLKQIEKLAPLAPLHNEKDIKAMRAAQAALPNIPVYGVFDTAFHRSLPDIASTYAIPAELAEKYQLRRYGFHGISYRYVSEILPQIPRLIVCHLGNGASVCAIKDGRSVDTSMGMTPLEGLVMGTRSGDIDAGLVTYLMRERRMDAVEIDDLLNHRSGLLGISGTSSDVRELLSSVLPEARLAIDVFCYRVAKYIASYVAVLGGVDAIAFTGGIGEHSSEIRDRICDRLAFLNVFLSQPSSETGLRKISKPGCLDVWVVPAEEEFQMAKEVRQVHESKAE